VRKVIFILCAVALLFVGITAANASATNWVLVLKATSPTYTNAGGALTVGIGPVAADAVQTQTWPTASGSAAVAERSPADTTFHAKHVIGVGVAPVVPDNLVFKLLLGARPEYTAATVRLSVFNNLQDVQSRDTLLDSNRIYKLYSGAADTGTLLAWWSTAVDVNPYQLDAQKWWNVSTLLKPKGWSPVVADTGWFIDRDVVKGAGFADLANYALASEVIPTPEPGSLLAFGSGLVGLTGFAIRRRKA
jgi:hypothetical protein